MSTIKDVAALAGVSISTVSRVINNTVPVDTLTKEQVINAIKELNYQPNFLAKGLKDGKTNTISLLIPSIRNPSLPIIVRGVEDVARKEGYTLILCNTDESIDAEKKYIEKMRNNWVDGMIFATAVDSSDHLGELSKSGFPTVLVSRQWGNEIDLIAVDNVKSGYIATEHLITRGYKRIGFTIGRSDLRLYRDRYKGYLKALSDYQIEFNEHFLIHAIPDEYTGICKFPGLEEFMTGKHKPDAIFATSDLTAISLIRAVKELGMSVPADLAVIGIDNIDISSQIDPPLTTIAQPLYEMGVAAANRLIKRIRKNNNLESIVKIIDATLIVRKST